jgi:hypothetical protein
MADDFRKIMLRKALSLRKALPPLVPQAGAPDEHPLLFQQLERWVSLVSSKLPPATFYIRTTFRLRGPCDVDALNRAMEIVAMRHESLRTEYEVVDGIPLARVLPTASVAFELLEVADEDALRSALSNPLPPRARGGNPLVRAVLFRLAPDDHCVYVLANHLVFDAWSADVLVDELRQAYLACRRQEEPPFEPLAVQ